MDDRTNKYANELARMIRHETVSEYGGTDRTKFYEFHELLRELFPHIFGACSFEEHEASFIMRWPGQKPGQKLLLMNHHDVVEATGEWKHPPFSGEIADDRLWGRGAIDDKGELWAMFKAADELAAEGFVPEYDIWFESACTEETDGSGADYLSSLMAERGLRFDMVLDEGGMILDEPISGAKGTFAMIGVGEKGCADLKFIARSSGGHASAPGKNTPLVRLGKFMAAIDRNDVFKAELSPVTCEMLRRLAPTMEGFQAKIMMEPEKFRPIISKVMGSVSPTAASLIKTTLAFTVCHGSEGNNVLPEEAYVIGNLRYSHHQPLEESLKEIRRYAKRFDIEVEVLDPGFSSSISDYRSDGFKLVEKAINQVFPGVITAPYLMTGASDARYMSRVSDCCIRFAPFKIDDEQMASIHGLNESVDLACLSPAVDFYKYVIREV
ncbi:MAG: M20/M25/M40 family metallo-hydrolase [Firmicutes bacterium]|nr:M20/M25/M40 family metallo-hydrolase [Bacillota bacterium]